MTRGDPKNSFKRLMSHECTFWRGREATSTKTRGPRLASLGAEGQTDQFCELTEETKQAVNAIDALLNRKKRPLRQAWSNPKAQKLRAGTKIVHN
eukprot:g7023.t1